MGGRAVFVRHCKYMVMFSQKGCLVKWVWQMFHRGFFGTQFLFLEKLGKYQKTSIKYLPTPFN